MSGEKKDRVFGISPLGEVMYAWLDKPQPGFKPGDVPKYSVTLSLDPDDVSVKAWTEEIKKIVGDGAVPIKRDKETNFLVVKFHTMKPPVVVDSSNTELPDDIMVGRGSVIRVSYGLAPYPGFGGGFTLYLNGVQVHKLVRYTPRSNFPDTDDGGYKVGDDAEETGADAGEEARDEANSGDDDNLPF